jgi:hypothetical protein
VMWPNVVPELELRFRYVEIYIKSSLPNIKARTVSAYFFRTS